MRSLGVCLVVLGVVVSLSVRVVSSAGFSRISGPPPHANELHGSTLQENTWDDPGSGLMWSSLDSALEYNWSDGVEYCTARRQPSLCGDDN